MAVLNEHLGQALNTLVDCLNRENRLMDHLLVVCGEQMEALKSGNHKDVETAVGKVGRLINGINTIEEERFKNKETLDAELGLDQDSSLADLLPYLSDDSWRELSALHREMKVKAERLRAVNEINSIMTRRIIDFNEMMINILNPKENLTYGASGSRQDGVGAGKVLVNKTV